MQRGSVGPIEAVIFPTGNIHPDTIITTDELAQGALTLYAPGEEEAVSAARIISVLYQQGGFGWNLSPHVWAYYAEISPLPPLQPFTFVLNESDAPSASDMVSLARWGPVHLWRRNDVRPEPYERKPVPIITNRFIFEWRERGA